MMTSSMANYSTEAFVWVTSWDFVCDQADLGNRERRRLWGRQILNPYALYDY